MSAFRIMALLLSLLIYVPLKIFWIVFVVLYRAYCEVSRFGTGTRGPVTWHAFDVTTRFHDGWWQG